MEANAASAVPLHLQVYRHLRSAIMNGTLGSGTRLPSTRTLAADLGLSRNTVEEAFSQLDAEGYVLRRTGDGTYVAPALPEQPLHSGRSRAPSRLSGRRLSKRSQLAQLTDIGPEPAVARPFSPGFPALDAFPYEIWHRLLARRSRQSDRTLFGYGDPAGYRPLREAIAAHLGTARGVTCDPAQVIILTSTQQALSLAAQLLLDPGEEAWLEDPGYLSARAALQSAGAEVIPVPVDESGLDVAAGELRAPRARLAYVTPSHQYPLGVTMNLERRLALLAWAKRAGAWIIEDDYDSEFRYAGRPLAAIQGLDDAGCVLYLGTLSKVMFPGLRLSYAVAPEARVDAFVRAKALADGHTALLHQAVLNDFIVEGHFGTHVRRMRALYQERRDVFRDAVRRELGARVELGPADGGLHLAGHLPAGTRDDRLSQRAAALGAYAPPLSRYYLGRPKTGLVFGYAACSPAEIRQGVRALSKAW